MKLNENLDLFKDQPEKGEEKDLRVLLERIGGEKMVEAFEEAQREPQQKENTTKTREESWSPEKEVNGVIIQVDAENHIVRGIERGVEPGDPYYTITFTYDDAGEFISVKKSQDNIPPAIIKRIYASVGKYVRSIVGDYQHDNRPGASHD